MYTAAFSAEIKEIIKVSRDIALETGYDYISTIHLFLADCRLNLPGSIRKYAFKDDDQLNQFIASSKIGDPPSGYRQLTLPLTKEAEDAINHAEGQRINHKQQLIKPCHIFLAAAADTTSLFTACYPDEPNLYDSLCLYYTEEGILKPEPRKAKQNFFSRLFKAIFKN
jgi:hypothetical protein